MRPRPGRAILSDGKRLKATSFDACSLGEQTAPFLAHPRPLRREIPQRFRATRLVQVPLLALKHEESTDRPDRPLNRRGEWPAFLKPSERSPGSSPAARTRSTGSRVTIVALFVGGWWTWRAFVRGRQGYPRCDITLHARHRALEDGSTLLHVEATRRNHGSVPSGARSALRVRAGPSCPAARH